MIVEQGPAGFECVEDGPVGADFRRPNGESLTDVSRAMMHDLGYRGGYFRGWKRPGAVLLEVGVLALAFSDGEAARRRGDSTPTWRPCRPPFRECGRRPSRSYPMPPLSPSDSRRACRGRG